MMSACSPQRPIPLDDAAAAESGLTATSETTASTATAETFVAPSPEVRAVLTSTGVVLRVKGVSDQRFLVETPCGLEAEVSGSALSSPQVVLDPGHGGDEAGYAGDPELSEADLNLRVAEAAEEILLSRSISVELTRRADYRVPISYRAALTDDLGALALVSIHHNSPQSAPSSVPGTEVYVQSQSEMSQRLGGLVYEEAFQALSAFEIEWSSRSDAGVLKVLNPEGLDAYGINRRPATPSALIEFAYLANPAEAELLKSDEYVAVAATALADAIERYLNTDELGVPVADTARQTEPTSGAGGTDGCTDPPLG